MDCENQQNKNLNTTSDKSNRNLRIGINRTLSKSKTIISSAATSSNRKELSENRTNMIVSEQILDFSNEIETGTSNLQEKNLGIT